MFEIRWCMKYYCSKMISNVRWRFFFRIFVFHTHNKSHNCGFDADYLLNILKDCLYENNNSYRLTTTGQSQWQYLPSHHIKQLQVNIALPFPHNPAGDDKAGKEQGIVGVLPAHWAADQVTRQRHLKLRGLKSQTLFSDLDAVTCLTAPPAAQQPVIKPLAPPFNSKQLY